MAPKRQSKQNSTRPNKVSKSKQPPNQFLGPFRCPNPECGKVYKNLNGLAQHYLHFSMCHQASVPPTSKQQTWQIFQSQEKSQDAVECSREDYERAWVEDDTEGNDDNSRFDFDADAASVRTSESTEGDDSTENGAIATLPKSRDQAGISHTKASFCDKT